jgi:DNA mismatch repair protein MutL
MHTLSRRVFLLDPHTVNQIAAGEVVERPASIVKELVENALDAGATRIEVELQGSGKTLVRVCDNGCGMSQEDALTALQRHATSKISTAEDLTNVLSLGFRGEALPSIASVARMTLSTATEDGLRTMLKIDGGNIAQPTGGAGPRGTDICVEDLFFNTPARLKFLKSDTTELGACLEYLYKYALGYPAIAFSVTHNGQPALSTTGSGDLFEAVSEIWGREAARSLAETECSTGGITVRGLVSPPHFTKPTRAFQYFFVNGRPVRSKTLFAALDQAYRDLTPEKRFPVVVLNLEIDAERVDVNVSPTKSEVKFQQEGQAFDAIRFAVRTALMQHGMVPDATSVNAANEALEAARSGSVLSFTSPGYGGGQPALNALSMLAQAPLEDGLVPEAPTYDPFSGASTRFPFGELVEGLRVLGQVMNTFIVAETRKGIAIIDQHVAHERIIYEYLCGLKAPTAIEKQALLMPETMTLDKRSAVLLRDRLDEVVRVGFELEDFGGETFILRAAPAALRGKNPVKILQDMVSELVEATVTKRFVPTREQIWITSSCKMAVKAGDPLSMPEMEKLIIDLASTENPYLCPHGRPITIMLAREELLRKFKRT